MMEIPIPILILLCTTAALGIVIMIILEIRNRQYDVCAYLLWTAALFAAIIAFTQEVVMVGMIMFYIAFLLIAVSTLCKLSRGGK